ncbi:MAG: CDP-alcohol phosphatidyltransferase family protein [Clostridia bacterium]|nr:CDP-alcohol phosphatidyltransferase family protein [Clostridia bacterium]
MIGFYDYTVWLTYISLISATVGIFVTRSGAGHPYYGAMFLLLCGLCDAFDGMVARTKQGRTEREKKYGIQIDSLTDLVAFGVLPACIGDALYRSSLLLEPRPETQLMASVPYPVYVTVFVVYVLAAMIRLAYFNVIAEENCERGESIKTYTGLPVTSSALIFPPFLMLRHLLGRDIAIFYYGVMLLVAGLFVSRFNIRKPGLRGVLIMVGIGALEFILILVVKYYGARAF